MTKLKETQDGFGAIEVLLAIIAVTLIGFVGFYVVHSNNNTDKTNSVTTQAVSDTVDTKSAATGTAKSTTPVISDNDAVVAAVKAYSGAGVSQKNAEVTINTIKGNNAQGHVSVGTSYEDGGLSAAFIAHKDGTVWTVVFEGQQAPGSDIGKKYDLPADWYIND